MIIGLMDWDLTKWKSPTVFNLELMKLSYYYKMHQHIVQMVRRYRSDMVTRLYIQKDYEDFDYPEEINKDEKVIWGGMALNNGIYVPMDLEIEQSKADPSIYNSMIQYYQGITKYKTIFRNLMTAQHLRLTFDGQHPFEGWEKQINEELITRNIILHDINLKVNQEIKDVVLFLVDKYGKKDCRLGFKFPIYAETIDELMFWGKIKKSIYINGIYVNELLDLDTLEELAINQNLIYKFDETADAQKVIEQLPIILKQGVYAGNKQIRLRVKLDNRIKIDWPWLYVVDFINAYLDMTGHYKLNFCPFSYCKYCYNKWTQEEKIFYFRFVQEHSPELFDLFYNMEWVDRRGQRLIPHMFTNREIYAIGGGYGQASHKRADNEEQRNYSEYVQPQYIYAQ